MKLTEFFRLRMPDGTDPVNIEDFNDNFEVIDRELKKRISDDGSASDVTVGFEVAESRQPLKSGEKLSVLMGKVHRFFTDLKTVAFSGKYGDLSERPSLGGASTLGVANNCTTTEAGFALDARQGKTLMDKSNELSRDLLSLNDSGAIKGMDAREDGVYITYVPTSGADPVTKKLGDIASAIKTGSYNYTHSKKGGFPKTLTHDTGKGNKLIAASVTNISNLNFYKWQQNYNAYAPGGVLCTCDSGIITVTFQGTPTNETETGANDYRTATIGVTYWYYED